MLAVARQEALCLGRVEGSKLLSEQPPGQPVVRPWSASELEIKWISTRSSVPPTGTRGGNDREECELLQDSPDAILSGK